MWQAIVRQRSSNPNIVFWYLRVGVAGLIAWAVFRKGLVRRYRLALFALAVAYRLVHPPRQVFPGGISDIEDAFSRFKSPRVRHRFVTSDGVDIAYSTHGCGSKIVLLANGIGCRDIYFVRSIQYFDGIGANEEYTLVTWDYRGLFLSGDLPENRTAKFSMRDHAEDGLQLLSHIGCECCHAALGWSTGVQVLLEMAAIQPRRIERLILLNGAHGHVFQSVLQPVAKIPCFGLILHTLAQLLRHPRVLPFARALYTTCLPAVRVCLLWPLAFLLGLNYESFFYNYLQEVIQYGEHHTVNYFKLASCLDAHSCFHALDEIAQPTLIIAGMLDVLTPAYHSFEMASRMPNARLFCYNFGSHFCALEYHEEISKLGEIFLKVPVQSLFQ